MGFEKLRLIQGHVTIVMYWVLGWDVTHGMSHVNFADVATDVDCVAWHPNGSIHSHIKIELNWPEIKGQRSNWSPKRIRAIMTYDVYFEGQQVSYAYKKNVFEKKLK